MSTKFLVYAVDGTDLGISADEFETAGTARWPGCKVVRTPAKDSDDSIDDGIDVTLLVHNPQDDHDFQIFHGRKGDRISTEACCDTSVRVALWVAGLTDEPVALLDLNKGIATAVPRGASVEDVESGWSSDIPRA